MSPWPGGQHGYLLCLCRFLRLYEYETMPATATVLISSMTPRSPEAIKSHRILLGAVLLPEAVLPPLDCSSSGGGAGEEGGSVLHQTT